MGCYRLVNTILFWTFNFYFLLGQSNFLFFTQPGIKVLAFTLPITLLRLTLKKHKLHQNTQDSGYLSYLDHVPLELGMWWVNFFFGQVESLLKLVWQTIVKFFDQHYFSFILNLLDLFALFKTSGRLWNYLCPTYSDFVWWGSIFANLAVFLAL